MRRRAAWVVGYVGAGLPVLVLVDAPRHWVLLYTLGLIWLLGFGNRQPVLRALFDWLPLLVILTAYDFVRAHARSIIPRAHLEPMIAFDEVVGGGTVPSVAMQDWWFRTDDPSWYDYASLLVYASHFFAAITVGLVVYFVARARFTQYAVTFLVCSLAGFATYVLYPAVPPWLASERGAIPSTIRAPDVLWDHLGLEFLSRVFSGDPEYSFPVGAVPSEHAAYPLLFLLLFWATASTRWRAALVAYVLAMAFVLVYFAEHYVFDIVVGWAYAVGAFLAVRWALARWRGARTGPGSEPGSEPGSDSASDPASGTGTDAEPGARTGRRGRRRRSPAAVGAMVGTALALGATGAAACGGDDDATDRVRSQPGRTEPAPSDTSPGSYVGLTRREAVARAEAQDQPWRVVRVDDETFPVTQDFVPERLNFEIDDGVVTKVTTG